MEWVACKRSRKACKSSARDKRAQGAKRTERERESERERIHAGVRMCKEIEALRSMKCPCR